MRKTSLEMVYELAKRDQRIFFIGSDLGIGTLKQFKAEMPERFLMEGVCEANIVGLASGLALEGKIVYINTIATFLTRRCFEQIALDLCLHHANVRLIGSGGGLVYAPLGPTHEAIDDIAILRVLPGMTIVAPADADEMRRLMPLTVDHQGPMYIRLGKGGDPIVTTGCEPMEIGKGFRVRAGSDALIVSTGVMLKPALDAAQKLSEQQIEATVLHMPSIKPLDLNLLLDAAGSVPVVVSVEEHSVIGGLGSAVAEALAEAGFESVKQFRRIGLPDAFPDRYGSQASLMEHYGLTADRIAAVVLELHGKASANARSRD